MGITILILLNIIMFFTFLIIFWGFCAFIIEQRRLTGKGVEGGEGHAGKSRQLPAKSALRSGGTRPNHSTTGLPQYHYLLS